MGTTSDLLQKIWAMRKAVKAGNVVGLGIGFQFLQIQSLEGKKAILAALDAEEEMILKILNANP